MTIVNALAAKIRLKYAVIVVCFPVILLSALSSNAIELNIKDKIFVSDDTVDPSRDTGGGIFRPLMFRSMGGGHDTLLIEGTIHQISGPFCSEDARPLVRLGLGGFIRDKSIFPPNDELRRYWFALNYVPSRGEMSLDISGFPGDILPNKSLESHKLYQTIYSLDEVDSQLNCNPAPVTPRFTHSVDYQVYIHTYNTVVVLKQSGGAAGRVYMTSMSYGFGELIGQYLTGACGTPCMDYYLNAYTMWNSRPNGTEALPLPLLSAAPWTKQHEPTFKFYTVNWQDVLSAMNFDWAAKAYPTRSPTLESSSAAGAFFGAEALLRPFAIYQVP